MKLIGICLMAATLAMAQDKGRAVDHSKASDSSAGKGQDSASRKAQDGASKDAAKARDRQHQKVEGTVRGPRDQATGQSSGR